MEIDAARFQGRPAPDGPAPFRPQRSRQTEFLAHFNALAANFYLICNLMPREHNADAALSLSTGALRGKGPEFIPWWRRGRKSRHDARLYIHEAIRVGVVRDVFARAKTREDSARKSRRHSAPLAPNGTCTGRRDLWDYENKYYQRATQ